MRKSPLSAPGGSGGQRNYESNLRGRRHGYSGTGYDQFQRGDSLDSRPMQASPQKTGDDFIPLGYSSPVNHHRHRHQQQQQQQQQRQQRNSGNWRGSGGWYGRRGGSGGYNSHRDNSYQNCSKSSYNDSNSPNYFQKQNFPHPRNRQKDAHRRVDISSYVNVGWMLEDPWADLMRKFEYNVPSEESKSDDPVNRNIDISESSSGNDNNLTEEDVVFETKTKRQNLDSDIHESENSNDLVVSKEELEVEKETETETETS